MTQQFLLLGIYSKNGKQGLTLIHSSIIDNSQKGEATQFSGLLSFKRKETETCCSMDEPRGHCVLHKDTVSFHTYEVPTAVKFIGNHCNGGSRG